MLFTENAFLFAFLPILWALYAIGTRSRVAGWMIWLIAAGSLFFYAYDSVRNTGLLLMSIGVNFAVHLALRRNHRIGILVAGVAFNLLLLGAFKYFGFVAENISWLFGAEWHPPKILLPLGISFYTFTQIAFIVDCYKTRPKVDFKTYLLFVTFFPHLIAGPIIHHSEMMPQFSRLGRRDIDWEEVAIGLSLFAIGLFKKLILADTFAIWVDRAYAATTALGTGDAWIGSLSYTLQLYFDFSGYADMAVGLSLLFGLRLPLNFNSPYKAQNIQDFWQRWHITLSRWLRNYLYIPLGGNRGSSIFVARNLMITFLLGGLWHGAGWTFIIWGALHGGAMIVHRIWSNSTLRLPAAAGLLITFLFVNAAWVFFHAASAEEALDVLRAMAYSPHPAFAIFKSEAVWAAAAVAGGIGIAMLSPNSQQLTIERRLVGLMPNSAFAGAMIAVAFILNRGATPTPFIYFNF